MFPAATRGHPRTSAGAPGRGLGHGIAPLSIGAKLDSVLWIGLGLLGLGALLGAASAFAITAAAAPPPG